MQTSMGFCQSLKSVMCSNYANFSGRARRKEFWYFFLFVCLINSVVFIPYYSLLFQIGNANSKTNYREDISTSLYLLFYLLLAVLIFDLIIFIPNLSVTVRRFHDIGKSGWFILVSLIPIVGFFILLYFMALDSEPSTNEYGFSPKYAVYNNNQTENFIAQNGPIYPPNPTPNNAYPQAPYINPVQQDPNQNLIYQQPYQNPTPQPYQNPLLQDPNQNLIYQQPYQNPFPQGPSQM